MTPKLGRPFADAGPQVIGLVCPECGEDAVDRPPTALFPYEAHGIARPDYSHPDGEPLCPVMGPRGYRPADPIEVTAPDPADDLTAAYESVAAVIDDPDTVGHRAASDDVRRDQLTRWHHDDQLAEPSHDEYQALDRTAHDHEAGA